MKLNRTYLFIAISSTALVIVLLIQLNWITKTALVKEELFNEKANIVLTRTSEALALDTVTQKNMAVCVGRNEIHKIDSLFRYYMRFYNFHIDYSFEVKPRPVAYITDPAINYSFTPQEVGCYQKNLEQVANINGFELNLLFPGKEEYIMEEMDTMFITSVILILVVLVMFWRTTVSLMKEKEISEHTTAFLNNMTHEFKTPLTNIALAGKMLIKESNSKPEEKVKHYTGIILEENEKLKLQVEHVLSMTALERGEIPLKPEELDFHELIHHCLKSIGIQIENRQGSLTLHLEAEKHRVTGDRTHLANALRNLVDNAIKYSNEKPELSIQTHNSAHYLVISITDKGIGIKKEYHEKVFDTFFRVPTGDVHDVKGFGLGLAYTKQIIELHGGTIELKSDADHGGKEKGTTFTIKLPYV